MKDWQKIAEAYGLNIPEAELERIAPALDAMEAAFRALAKKIPDDVEPAITFRVYPELGE